MAMVGSRRCTGLGREYASKIGQDISQRGIPLVSGLAIGIDTIAHETAVCNHQKTIAVLGGGLHHIYPSCNRPLAEKILENGGAIVTEYDNEEEPLKYHFRDRNRIIAALSDGVIVIEAGKESGSLITAKDAIKLERNLFVLPGRVCDENYEGSNMLLVEGAKCILSAKDVLKEFPQFQEEETSQKHCMIPKEYETIYQFLKTPKTADEIARGLSLSISYINVQLTMMEISGYVQKIGGNLFHRI